ncbi:Tn3 family transposase [Streptomyces sp. NPDC057908]|uniref:Tn3 family transposase n=1 Tax=Streptomyces sp. NPDC057908 TaxID=3346276 RepID=UPI0036EB581A
MSGKRGATRLGFAVLLKFYTQYGRFPRGRAELAGEAVEFVARQVQVPASALGFYDWTGRTVEYHRAQIREHLGFRECSVADAEKLTAYLAEHIADKERRPEQVRVELLARCRTESIEPPTSGRCDRIVGAALRAAEESLTALVSSRLTMESVERIVALVAGADQDDAGPAGGGAEGEESPPVLAKVKEAPGNVSLETEITDTLVELLISTVHRIGARAEKKVTEQLVNAFKKVSGKENILFKLAEASLGAPEGTVRQVVFPAVSGGEATLRELVHEFKTRGPVYRRTVQTTLKVSYTNHYRRGLIRLLDVLEFRSSNDTHRPVIEALALVARYANAGNTTYYPLGETVPVHKAMGGDWAEVVHRTDRRGRRRVVRMVYEVVAFQALRDQLKCKEIWVVGADKWRNPDEDLPQDFEARRAENYRDLRKPLDAAVFVDELREQMTAELTLLNDKMPKLSWLDIAERKSGAIRLTAAEAQPEPRNLRRIKAEVQRRWGVVPLVDMLKEAVLRTGCLDAVTSVSGGGSLSPEVLAERLLLVIYAYGTNTGIKAVASGGHGHTEDELRYVRRRYLSAEAARAIAVQIANATFAARSTELWGQGSTAVVSDSTHVRAYDQNLFTEWHSRYGGRGVLIYWHVEKKSLAIHSQLINCTASEVAAMIEGAMRHGTTMDVEANYTDSHGQSEIGFGITRLLNFDLLPRIKRINKVRLYRPVAGEPDAYPQLTPALTRPIRWELITQQYDQMIKYATAIRTRTASTEAILRRFTRNASHPTYAAMLEVGRAQKTIFVARYLRLRDLQREIEEGLNVMEFSNGANSVIAYGKGGEIASNRRDEQEMFVLCLRILQSALVYVNTLMLQDILGEPEWADLLTPADRRGPTPLFWSHVRPYGEVNLDMGARLDLAAAAVPGPRAPADQTTRSTVENA